MCSATSTQSDSRVENNDYFKRRVLGFKAEIEFEKYINQYLNSNKRFLEGGQFISKKITGEELSKNSFIYTTLSFDEPECYSKVYNLISKWDEVSELIYIKIVDDAWNEEQLEIKNEDGVRENSEVLKPNFKFYLYNKETNKFAPSAIQDFSIILNHFGTRERRPNLYPLRKREQFEYFSEYDIVILKKIYANRYFLDVILRQAQGRQVIDLDGFIDNNGEITLVEIKEKSPITEDTDETTKWKYGWDTRRILWYLYLLNNIKLSVLYNVRQINNRQERKFIQWDSIYIDDFLKGISWSSSRGGGGGEDTLLAPYLYFRRLEDVLGTNSII
jgi:hypothetical protein